MMSLKIAFHDQDTDLDLVISGAHSQLGFVPGQVQARHLAPDQEVLHGLSAGTPVVP